MDRKDIYKQTISMENSGVPMDRKNSYRQTVLDYGYHFILLGFSETVGCFVSISIQTHILDVD
jgi:hypothetical protein